MKILFMGTPDFAVPCLDGLLKAGHTVLGVVTQPDKPVGRKKVMTPPIVKAFALEHGLPVYQPETLKGEAFLDTLKSLDPEVIVVVAYGKILPAYILDYPKYGCINVHGSILPRWRGAAPIQWSVIAGDEEAGVTTMQMDRGLDTGDMLLVRKTPIGARETAGELFDRLAQMGAELLLDTLVQAENGTLQPIPQDDAQSCYASMLDKQMAVIDWSRTMREIDCQVRGLNPWPIALTFLDGAAVKVYAAVPEKGHGEPGEVLEADTKNGLIVACGDGAMRISELQMVGGKRMDARDYLRGHSIPVGVRFTI